MQHIRSISILFVTSIVITLSSCESPASIVVASTERSYRFDPSIIQQSIDAGYSVFQIESVRNLGPVLGSTVTRLPTPTLLPILRSQPVAWNEHNFDQVVKSLAKYLDDNLIKDSTLFQLEFETSCKDVDFGPQAMTFGFFTLIQQPQESLNKNTRYLRGWITIDAQTGRLILREDQLSHVEYENIIINRGDSYIPAEIALRLAESAGGTNTRVRIGNACSIIGFSTGDVSNGDWQVFYKTFSGGRLFGVKINRGSGQTMIVITAAP